MKSLDLTSLNNMFTPLSTSEFLRAELSSFPEDIHDPICFPNPHKFANSFDFLACEMLQVLSQILLYYGGARSVI